MPPELVGYTPPQSPDVVCDDCGEYPVAADRLVAAVRQLHEALDEAKRRLDTYTMEHAVPVEAAEKFLGCGRTRVFALLKAGKLVKAPSPGRNVMITRASIDLLLTEGVQRAVSAPKRNSRVTKSKSKSKSKDKSREADLISRLSVD